MVFLLVVAVSVSLAESSAGQLESGIDNLGRAFRLIDAAYPDVLKGATNVRVGGDVFRDPPWLREFGIRIADSITDLQREPNSPAALQAFFLQATFQFDSNGLRLFAAHGRVVNDPENASFCEYLQANPESSEDRIAAELGRRGARFGPEKKDELLAHVLPAPTLAEVAISPPLAISRAIFVVPSPKDRSGMLPVGCVEWQVSYRLASGDSSFEYIAHVEPFAGRLGIISRQQLTH
jgi:hypothetical protein